MAYPVSKAVLAGAGMLAALLAVPALADVKAGVDAWSRGDYSAAVREWEAPAAAGDPDAMFNLGQAYRLGQGVAVDQARAEDLYARAASAGHIQAADTYGLLLFQDGRREQALPYVQDAARRGDPRSQYLLGIAHFNGDIVPRDWVRAYALLTLANGAGLPQAAPAIAEMDRHIALTDRQRAAGLAIELEREAQGARTRELAAADLGSAAPAGAAPSVPSASPRIPRPIPNAPVSPSIAAARTAVAEASRATGTESPELAGASFAGGRVVQARAEPAATPALAQAPAPVPTPAPPAPTPAPAASSDGPWRVQLGAFSVAGNADRLWSQLSSRAELAGKRRLMVPAGRVTKLQAGGFASRAAADTACRALKQSGQDCLVTRD